MELKKIVKHYNRIAFITKSDLDKYEAENGKLNFDEVANTILNGKYSFVGFEKKSFLVEESAIFEAKREKRMFETKEGDLIQIAECGKIDFEFAVTENSVLEVDGVWNNQNVSKEDYVDYYVVSHPDINGEEERVTTDIGGKELLLNGKLICVLHNSVGDGWYSLFFSEGVLK